MPSAVSDGDQGGFVLPLISRLIIATVIIMQMLTMNAYVGVTNIANQQLAALLAQRAALVDIRTEPEWRQTGIIPGSHLLTLFDEQRRLVDPDGWAAEDQKGGTLG